jgi:hypothetical protein
MSALPFKYREKRNAYFKEYMRKRRAQEKRNKSVNGVALPTGGCREQKARGKDSVKFFEIVAA